MTRFFNSPTRNIETHPSLLSICNSLKLLSTFRFISRRVPSLTQTHPFLQIDLPSSNPQPQLPPTTSLPTSSPPHPHSHSSSQILPSLSSINHKPSLEVNNATPTPRLPALRPRITNQRPPKRESAKTTRQARRLHAQGTSAV